jgi:hypothetical protein
MWCHGATPKQNIEVHGHNKIILAPYAFLRISSSIVCSSYLLVFYVDNILDDKNTLCNGCFLTRFISFIQNLQVKWTVFDLSHEDVFSKSNQLVPVQPSKRAFEGV